MSDQVRGPDAADKAPKPKAPEKAPNPATASRAQDAPNYDRRVDQDLAEPVEVMNSANDE